MKFAGIGARKTPKDVIEKMRKISLYLTKKGYVLRSGGADGADSAFESTAVKSEIFLSRDADFHAIKLAETYHPNFKALKTDYARGLMGRNMMILLGSDVLNPQPVDFVICWTPKGKITGGTGHSLRAAIDYSIPIFNLATDPKLLELKKYLKLS